LAIGLMDCWCRKWSRARQPIAYACTGAMIFAEWPWSSSCYSEWKRAEKRSWFSPVLSAVRTGANTFCLYSRTGFSLAAKTGASSSPLMAIGTTLLSWEGDWGTIQTAYCGCQKTRTPMNCFGRKWDKLWGKAHETPKVNAFIVYFEGTPSFVVVSFRLQMGLTLNFARDLCNVSGFFGSLQLLENNLGDVH